MAKQNVHASLEAALEKVICSEALATQQAIVNALKRCGIAVPDQSTVSRALKRLGVVKLRDHRTVKMIYRWPPKRLSMAPPKTVLALVKSIVANESTIVIHTDPGSAALVARYVDVHRPAGVIGTIAGDDTVFVAPRSNKETLSSLQELKKAFGVS